MSGMENTLFREQTKETHYPWFPKYPLLVLYWKNKLTGENSLLV